MHWISFQDNNSHTYYYNPENGKVQWNKPEDMDIPIEYPLPVNIKEVTSKTTGNEYYFNRITGESIWKIPSQANNFSLDVYHGSTFKEITETFKDNAQLYGTVVNMCPTGIKGSCKDKDLDLNLGLVKYNDVAVAIILWIVYEECVYIDSVCSSKIITKWENKNGNYPKEWKEKLQSNIDVTDALSTYMGSYLIWAVVHTYTNEENEEESKPVILQNATSREGYYESMGFKVTKDAELLGKCHVHKETIDREKLMIFDGNPATLFKKVEENMAKFFEKFRLVKNKDFVMDITSVFFWGDRPCGREKAVSQSDIDKANIEFDKRKAEDPNFYRPRLYLEGCHKGLELDEIISDWAIAENPKVLAITQGKLGMFKGK